MSNDYFYYLFADLKKNHFYFDFTREITTYDFGVSENKYECVSESLKETNNLLLNKLQIDNRHLLTCLVIICIIYLRIFKKNHFYLDFARKFTTCGFGEVKINMSKLLKV